MRSAIGSSGGTGHRPIVGNIPGDGPMRELRGIGLIDPVQWLTWYEAMAYVRWLAEKREAPYRLPTEAEWEKAASWDDKAKKKTKPLGRYLRIGPVQTSRAFGQCPSGAFHQVAIAPTVWLIWLVRCGNGQAACVCHTPTLQTLSGTIPKHGEKRIQGRMLGQLRHQGWPLCLELLQTPNRLAIYEHRRQLRRALWSACDDRNPEVKRLASTCARNGSIRKMASRMSSFTMQPSLWANNLIGDATAKHVR